MEDLVISASIEVVIPTFNGVSYLEAQLASIYEQTLQGSTTIDVENYSNGTYIFAFYGFCGLIKSFKVLKNN